MRARSSLHVSLGISAAAHVLRLGVVILLVLCGGCGDDSPTPPTNRPPVITSLDLFPTAIGKADSAVVVCFASDPDGDALVYDWTTDGRLNIEGTPPYFHYLYNTDSPIRTFYPAAVDSPVDTAWIECGARDQRGGEVHAIVYLVVRQDGMLIEKTVSVEKHLRRKHAALPVAAR